MTFMSLVAHTKGSSASVLPQVGMYSLLFNSVLLILLTAGLTRGPLSTILLQNASSFIPSLLLVLLANANNTNLFKSSEGGDLSRYLSPTHNTHRQFLILFLSPVSEHY